MDDEFRSKFRAEMDEFRKDFQKDKLEGNLRGCGAERQNDVRRERRDEEFHEKQVDFHREFGDKSIDENRGVSQENEKGGY